MLHNYFLYWPCGTNHRWTHPAPFEAFVEGGTNKAALRGANQLYIGTIPHLKLLSSACLTVSDWRRMGIKEADEPTSLGLRWCFGARVAPLQVV